MAQSQELTSILIVHQIKAWENECHSWKCHPSLDLLRANHNAHWRGTYFNNNSKNKHLLNLVVAFKLVLYLTISSVRALITLTNQAGLQHKVVLRPHAFLFFVPVFPVIVDGAAYETVSKCVGVRKCNLSFFLGGVRGGAVGGWWSLSLH